jgi:hypothetical protein
MSTNPQWPVYNLREALLRLPVAARRKHAALVALRDDQRALADAASERAKQLDEACYMLAARLDRLDPRTEAETIAQVKDELEATRVMLDDLLAQRGRRTGMQANTEQVLARLEPFVIALVDGPGAGAGTAGVRPISIDAKPRRNETVANAIMRIRGEITALQGEIYRVQHVPPPVDDIKAHITAEIDRLAARGRPTIKVDGSKIDVRWPDHAPFAPVDMAPGGTVSAMLAWMFHDQLLASMLDGVERLGEGGIGAADRAARERELKDKIMRLEHDEEALVTTAIADGLECHRRPSASGFALLGIEPVPAAELIAAE